MEAQTVLGTARQIRTDEWMVFTPMTQLAVRGGFSVHDQVSPYGQTLKGFMALPIADWSLAFKPQLWAYWILPPAYAYSAYWAIMWCSMLAGYTILLRQCRVPLTLAALGSVTLWMSHYVQVWWTGPAPAFALAPWPAVVLASGLRPVLKWAAFPYVVTVWMLGAVYPPYQIPSAFALGALLLALRRDIFTARTVILLALSAILVLGIGWYYLHDVIIAMRSTVYPGARVSDGGGVSAVQVLAHLLPYVSTVGFVPLITGSNECEIAVVSSLLPLLLLTCADYASLKLATRRASWALWIVGAALGVMFAWMTLPIPSYVGRFLLLHYVPPYRLTWAFGMLLTLSTVVVLSRVRIRFSPARLALCGVALSVSWLAGQRLAADSGRRIPEGTADWFELAGVLAIAAVWIGLKVGGRILQLDDRVRLLAAAAVAGAVTFGTFNPIQSARVIFDIPPSARQDEFREQARLNPNGWLVASGMYGAILNGAGIPSINHCLATPQLDFFRAVFPNLDDDRFNQIFNRYANIMARPEPAPRLLQADAVIVPIDDFTRPQPAAVEVGARQRKEGEDT